MLEPPECSGPPGPASRPHRSPPSAREPGDGGRLLLVGARRRVRRLARGLDGQAAWSGLPIVGFVDASGRGRQLVVHPSSEPVPVLGRLDRLAELVARSRATDVVVALSGQPAVRLRPKLERLSGAGSEVRVHWVGEGEPAPPAIPASPESRRRAPRPPLPLLAQRIAKRGLDILGAAIGLAILAPLFLVVSLLILLTDGRPIFYSQARIGRGGRVFRIWKFRSMRRDAEAETGPIWAEDHDRRCTRVGDWLRHTNIDELPQLFNVLLGDMSLVGPRPERPMFVEKFQAEQPDYDLRHAVPVGMTGWAQVHGWRGRTSLRKRIQYDLDYIGRWSFWLDVQILFMTVQHVLYAKTSWGPASRPRRPEP
jgi:exopolysaccharide biosynthesis polyprenyl glycosylphosphotransferase